MEASNYLHKEPCTECGSSDGLARYDDGHAFCFVCQHREHADGDSQSTPKEAPQVSVAGIIPGSYVELTRRGLTAATCKFWSYQVGEFKGQKVQLANYIDEGSIIAQKVRFADKSEGMPQTGNSKAKHMYGQWLWKGASRARIVITEGELDAMTVYQVSGGQLVVVSLPDGAGNAKKSIMKDYQWLTEFKEIVLCFDNDEAGQKATIEVAKALPPGRVKIVGLPLKDASDMHKSGLSGELYKAILNAKTYKPAELVKVADVRDKMLQKKTMGLPWWDDRLTAETYGRRTGEIYMFGAGTGIGKTDWLTQQMAYDLNVLDERIGVFALEQEPDETATRLAGKCVGKALHVPDGSWTDEEFSAAVDLIDDDRLTLYNHFGANDWEGIAAAIRYVYASEGTRIFYIDHLTAIAAAEDDERTGLERVMAQMGALVKEIPIMIHCVSHLSTPEGKSHEEGGRVTIRNFKGSRAIGFWSHFMFGMERDPHNPDPVIASTTIFRILKDRFTGRSTAKCLPLTYYHVHAALVAAPAGPAASPFPAAERNTDFT